MKRNPDGFQYDGDLLTQLGTEEDADASEVSHPLPGVRAPVGASTGREVSEASVAAAVEVSGEP